jgi:hypothetical protein
MDVGPAAGLLARRINPDAIRTAHNSDKRSLGDRLPTTDTGSLWFVPATDLLTSGHTSSWSRHSLLGDLSEAGLTFPFSKFIAFATTFNDHLA